jgi:hypothetical protein
MSESVTREKRAKEIRVGVPAVREMVLPPGAVMVRAGAGLEELSPGYWLELRDGLRYVVEVLKVEKKDAGRGVEVKVQKRHLVTGVVSGVESGSVPAEVSWLKLGEMVWMVASEEDTWPPVGAVCALLWGRFSGLVECYEVNGVRRVRMESGSEATMEQLVAGRARWFAVVCDGGTGATVSGERWDGEGGSAR